MAAFKLNIDLTNVICEQFRAYNGWGNYTFLWTSAHFIGLPAAGNFRGRVLESCAGVILKQALTLPRMAIINSIVMGYLWLNSY